MITIAHLELMDGSGKLKKGDNLLHKIKHAVTMPHII